MLDSLPPRLRSLSLNTPNTSSWPFSEEDDEVDDVLPDGLVGEGAVIGFSGVICSRS